jgi:hypothetical protein
MARLLIVLIGVTFLGISTIHATTNIIHAAGVINAHLTGITAPGHKYPDAQVKNIQKYQLQAYSE